MRDGKAAKPINKKVSFKIVHPVKNQPNNFSKSPPRSSRTGLARPLLTRDYCHNLVNAIYEPPK